ncbi:3-deoxy-manno-octulosonate cytidylyltransferase [uncultured Draconibacterium sp.]|uniref:3-deoxy-manno-octulosonate cytidylyltransferase n=1 Tax=uncultured Draconibacterium sp. TaxID=1573823 RepID=UPI0029C6F402|nr:3-deoxy-manno-octulosonate cytidylyltransferase [uncultured Draconibacterium sp.]
MNKSILIVIPARYQSTRLPGKPLQMISGIPMIERVAKIAEFVSKKFENCTYVVATDDDRILNYCQEKNISAVMTSESCKSGTERCYDAVCRSTAKPDFIINLQGDNPLCPPWFIEQIIMDWQSDSQGQVFTPFVHLNWEELDILREAKMKTPYSGTTVQVDKLGYALTFSKLNLPAIRKEEKLRNELIKSPVRRHIGLYAYTLEALEQYFNLEPGEYEKPEGLEQMRFVEHRIPVKMVEVDYRGRKGMSGVDSPEDVKRAEDILREYGEFDLA